MNIISSINLANEYDEKALKMRDTANIFEFSGMIQLKTIFDYIELTDPSVSYGDGEYSLPGNKGVRRQAILNSFDINAAKVLEDFNAYRAVFLNLGTNIDIPNTTPTVSPFPKPPAFIIVQDLGSQNANINAAHAGTDGVNRRLVGTVSAKYRNALGETSRDIFIKVYETYIKQSNNHIIYYRWHHYVEENGTTHIAYVSQSYDGIEIEDDEFSAPVSLQDDGDWVGLLNHGIPQGTKIKFNTIVGTIGISENVEYKVYPNNDISGYETHRFKIVRTILGVDTPVVFTNTTLENGTANLTFSRELLVSF